MKETNVTDEKILKNFTHTGSHVMHSRYKLVTSDFCSSKLRFKLEIKL